MNKLQSWGTVFCLIALFSLISSSFKVFDERYTTIASFEVHEGDGILKRVNEKENKGKPVYRVQLPSGEATYTGNIREWILPPTVFLAFGTTLTLIGQLKRKRPIQTELDNA